MTAAHCPSCGFNLRRDEVLELDGFSIDPRGLVTRAGARIALTRTETAVLYAIASGGGRPVSSEAIANRATEADDAVNVVRVMVRRIRAKLMQAGVPDAITTCWGSGYAWAVAA